MALDVKVWLDNLSIRLRSVKEVPKGTALHNRNGTSANSPQCPNCGSWLDHWAKITGCSRPEAGNCAVCGGGGLDEYGRPYPIEGCHVNIVNSEDQRVYIVPLCKKCNAKHGQDVVLCKSMKLAVANYDESCSKLKDVMLL